jgi:hypothetical protein
MHVTVNISQKLYERARRLAEQRQQDVNEVLSAALDEGLETLQKPSDAGVSREKAAYQQLFPVLAAQYAGQHVAIYGGKLVDHDEDGIALSQRIYKQYPHEFVWITKVSNQPIREFRSHSFRWAHD